MLNCTTLKKCHFLWILPAIFLLFLAAVLLANKITDNIHTVLPHQLYRSAQLEFDALTQLVKRHKIKSIVNLRGVHTEATWYQSEMKLAAAQNLQHYTINLPAHGLATRAELKQLVAVLQAAPQPILVHCRQGADRTGLASAIGIILSGNTDPQAATRQVSWMYNVLSPDSVGVQVLSNYFAWLAENHQTYGKQSFLTWLNSAAVLKAYHGNFIVE
jgi:undecaprenyl-diphosphatase